MIKRPESVGIEVSSHDSPRSPRFYMDVDLSKKVGRFCHGLIKQSNDEGVNST